MELDGTFGKIELRSDFLVRQTLEHPIEHFFFAACQSDGTLRAMSGFENLLSPFRQSRQAIGIGRNHDHVICRRLTSNHAVHGKKTGGMVHGEFPIRAGVYMEMCGTGGLFIEKIHRSCL